MEEEAMPSRDEVQEVLDRTGAGEALAEALASAGLGTLPESRDALVAFFESALLDALVGRVHPVTARGLVEELVARTSWRSESGMRVRPEELRSEVGVATVPPPPMESASDTYDALATGEVHTRATPAWGLRRTGDGEIVLPTVWLLVTSHPPLIDLARRGAPVDTEVIEIVSLAALESALERSNGVTMCVVLDAGAPSLPIDRAIATVALHAAARVLLWRMGDGERRRWIDAVPAVRTWLPCEAEVTPTEIVQLLGA